jgi:hypothetical protein
LIIDPPDGKIPSLTPEAQKRQAAFAEYRRQHPGDGPEDFSLNNRCILWPTAGPPMLPGGYNNNYEIIQTPEYVTILVEMIHDARIIPLDGRPHLPSSVAAVDGGFTRSLGGRHTGCRNHELHQQNKLQGRQREYASDRALHAHGCEHHYL